MWVSPGEMERPEAERLGYLRVDRPRRGSHRVVLAVGSPTQVLIPGAGRRVNLRLQGYTATVCCGVVGLALVGRPPTESTGVLEGRAVWRGGELPTPTLIRNTTDPEVCGADHTLDDLVVSADLGVQNVIAALVDVPIDLVPPAVPGRVVLDNADCRFSPHASVLTVGSVIETHNSDPTLHTTHLYGASEVNLALPLEGQSVSHTVDRPGLIAVKCDVHGWMSAFVRVDEHPFHAVSNASGSFRIVDLPAGDYVLEAWHERLGTRRREVRIVPDETSNIVLEFTGER